jgi:hypothetical protein
MLRGFRVAGKQALIDRIHLYFLYFEQITPTRDPSMEVQMDETVIA